MADRPEETVAVEVRGTDNKVYKGEFVWVRRSLADMPAIASETSRLLRGQPAGDSQAGQVVQIMAELSVVTRKGPVWWDYETLFDPQVLFAVYNRYVDWRDSLFRLKPKPEEPVQPQ